MAETKSARLVSLDLLRGLDMLLLTVVGPFFTALNEAVGLPDAVMRQFHHAWGGFTLWDLIMPLFIFMCGAAVPFALGRRLENGRTDAKYWIHVAKRFALLWFLGMVAQGRLLTLDLSQISFFDNTLQTIACGYLVAAIALPVKSRKVRIALPMVLALAYAAFLHFGGDYSQTGNAAAKFETWFVSLYSPAGSRVLEMADPGYTWWATIPMFGAMTLCGLEASNILLGEGSGGVRAARLALMGAALLTVGWALSPWIPPIKHIYTLTFTAQAMGWCCLLYAALHFVGDVIGWRRGTWLIVLFGQTSLMAYMIGDVFKCVPRAFGAKAASGFPHAFGEASAPLGRWFFAAAFLVVALTYIRRARAARRVPKAKEA